MDARLLVWVLFVGVLAFNLVEGLRFRSGRIDDKFSRYRDVGGSRMWRHAPLVAPVASAAGLVAFLLISPAFLPLEPLKSIFASLGDLGLVIAALSIPVALVLDVALCYWLPARLIPGWLRAEDARDGFVSPPPTWFDRVSLVASALGTASLAVLLPVVLN